ncbi:MAG: purple acid phosphatase family protein [Promethearchaeota archaeon]
MSLVAKRNLNSKFLIIILIVSIIFINLTNIFLFNYRYNENFKFKFDKHIEISAPLTPAGIRITVVNDSSNSMVITWYTTADATDPKVEYSTDSSLTNNITIRPTSKYIDSTYIYSANLKDLKVNTTYYYKVSSDGYNERAILNFTTLPARNASSLKFLLFGDSRSQSEQRTELVKKIMENFADIEFIVHTGDIVEDGRIQTKWNDYFEDIEILTKKIPGYYIEGNHERLDGYMYDNIPLPSNGLNSFYYNFSIGPINFIGLNTERDISIQTTWLEEVLKNSYKDNNSLWNIAYMHQPIFGSYHPDRSDLISAWCPIFEEYNLDLVFAGHNHYYERSYPMNSLKQYDNSSSYEFENPSNPMYLTTGGAGVSLHERTTNPDYAPFYNSTYHFIIIDINVDDIKEETNLTLETWAMPDDYSGIYLIDNITIMKKGVYIDIQSPENYQLFGKIAPNFNINVDKGKIKPTWFTINTSWYTIDGGTTNFTFTGSTGTINQTAWNFQLNGTVNIQFYINDSLGNLEHNSVIVRKDITLPNISILDPSPNQVFGKKAPNFTLLIDKPNLNLSWYTIDDGIMNFTFTEQSGTINQTSWDLQPNGTVNIQFYVNDSLGNRDSTSVIVRRDITLPNISILNPLPNQFFGRDAPNFTLLIDKPNLNFTWYTINDGITNFIFTGLTGTINQTIWYSLGDGLIKLLFYANDTLGNIGRKEVLIRKDTIAPIITIIYPQENEIYGINPPNFTVYITDYNLDSMWYSFNESDVNIIFNENSTINQEEWEKLANGKFELIFFANDSASNVAFEVLIINKNISKQNNLIELLGALISFFTILTIAAISYTYVELKRKKNRKL